MAIRHSLGTDVRRYRLTMSEAQDVSWRSIRYIRPQQKLQEVRRSSSLLLNSHECIQVSQWPSTTPATICTLRVVIVPCEAEQLADTEPITFTYLYRQVTKEAFLFIPCSLRSSKSINDYVRERPGSEISVDVAVQLTALLVLDESLCTGVRATTLVKYVSVFSRCPRM